MLFEMRIAIITLLLVVATVLHGAGVRSFNATVERVVDGDTLVCLIDLGEDTFKRVYVRLWKVSAQEVKTPQGDDAKKRMAVLLPRGTPLRLDVKGRSHGRLVCVAWSGAMNINEEAVRLGICRVTSEKDRN